MITITPREFSRLQREVHRLSGIETGPGKEYLFETRLQGLLREEGFGSFTELCDALAGDAARNLKERVVSAVSTKETSFFRNRAWFDLLRFKIFPDLIDERVHRCPGANRDLTVWSAGCSTGQEVYSVIMAFLETVRGRSGARIKVLGTDISEQAVARASYGEYSDFEVGRGLDACRRDRYFQKSDGGWRVRDEVRALAVFSRVNLLAMDRVDNRFDVALCRNVGIYFSGTDRVRLFGRVASSLRPGGYLLLGASESLGCETALGLRSLRHLNAHYYRSAVADRKGDPPSCTVQQEKPGPVFVPPPVPATGASRPDQVSTADTPHREPAGGGEGREPKGVLARFKREPGPGLLDGLRPEARRGVLEVVRGEGNS